MSYSEGNTRTSDECPGCGSALALQWLGAVRAGECPSCRGLWLARRDLGAAIGTWVSMDPAQLAHSPRKCTRCRRPMEEKKIRSVVLDACQPCGRLFLDDGELEHLKSEAAGARAALATTLVAARPEPKKSNLSETAVDLGELAADVAETAVDAAQTTWDVAELVGAVLELVGALADL